MFSTFLNICLLRANPQDLPTSTSLLILALLAHFAVEMLTAFGKVPLWNAFFSSAASTLLLVAVIHTALLLRNLQVRVKQTLTALAGCGAGLILLAFLAISLLHTQLPLWLVGLPFLIWLLVVYGHILRHAFSISFGLAIAVSVLYRTVAEVIKLSFLVGSPPAS